ncbi:MT-A70 family methyltransferase [Methylocystis parvus]|uniref:MT-A70 family methyltransferase n=1 Tax=Methylocystis parvus TaxID=134 RepID=UPI003C73456F
MSAEAGETREEFEERYGAVAQYDAALAALAAATMAESQEMLAKADAIELFAKRARDPDLLDKAVALSLAAQRRAGELLRKMADEGAREARGGDRKSKSRKPTLKLASLGVTKDQSAAWQKLAGLSLSDFEECVAERQKDARRALAGSRAERAQAKKERRAEREEALAEKIRALPEKRYGVIYADPEWRFEVRSERGLDRAADNHYSTSALAEICARDVASIAADDCVLFMWVTTPMLGDFPLVLDSWGFEYKSCIVWGKDKAGTGYWTRDKAEHLIIATRGNPPCPAPGEQFESLIEAPVGAHSAKPERFAEIIEAMFPTLPKIELNRRGPPRAGWDAWGNEAEESEAEND